MTAPETDGGSTVSSARRVDQRCDAFEAEWRAGRQPAIEAFLDGLDDVDRSLLVRELVALEAGLCREAGAPVAIEQYLRRFPEHADGLRELFSSDKARPAVDSIVGHYRLLEKIGEGGMGAVYRAAHTLISREVALKLLKPELAQNPKAVRRFLTEAQACVNLRHRNIVNVYDVGRHGGVVYMTMALIDGVNLARHVDANGPMAPIQAAQVIEQIARGLEHAHQAGIIHRDIKPANIMLKRSGRVKILDMGLARVLESEPEPVATTAGAADEQGRWASALTGRLTTDNALLGTIAYMSPEQVRDPRDAGAGSDIYSLGCTFFYLLTGQDAYRGATVKETLANHEHGRRRSLVELLPDVDSALVRVLDRMLALRPQDRYSSALAVARSLARWRRVDGQQAVALAVPSPLDRLRQDLLDLSLIRQADWDSAALRAGSSTPTPQAMLESLRQLQTEGDRVDRDHGLTEYQVEQMLAGDARLLQIDDYLVVERLAGSVKGEMFKARQRSTEQLAALRVFSADSVGFMNLAVREQFVAEAGRLKSLVDPGLPKTYGVGIANEAPYLALEFIAGPSMRTLFDGAPAEHRPRIDVAAAIARQVAHTLEQSHRLGILHGDIKPGNIVLTPQSGIRLMDLGVSWLLMQPATTRRSAKATRTENEMLLGTPEVMPPEQWAAAELTTASDVYSLGCTLFFLLTRSMPFVRQSRRDYLFAHVAAPAPLVGELRSDVPFPLSELVAKMLAKHPQERALSMSEISAALTPFATNDAVIEIDSLFERPEFERSKRPSGAPTAAAPAPGAKWTASSPRDRQRSVPASSRLGLAGMLHSALETLRAWWAGQGTPTGATPSPLAFEPADRRQIAAIDADQTGKPAVGAASAPSAALPSILGTVGQIPPDSFDEDLLDACMAEGSASQFARSTRAGAQLPPDLRRELIDLRIITADDWDRAASAVASPALPAVLEQLARQRASWPPSVDEKLPALTRYQLGKIGDNQAATLRLDRYLLVDRLGAGGMGEVFKAIDVNEQFLVALKVIPMRYGDWAKRFQREAQALREMTARGDRRITRVYKAGFAGDRAFFAIEYLRGRNLQEVIRQEKSLPGIGWAVRQIIEAAEALQSAHDAGIIHRDIKPSNLMITESGQLKLLDLGVARLQGLDQESADSRSTLTTQRSVGLGTPAYMPPEQWADATSVTAASDIYGLGCTLFFALTGRPPYDRPNLFETMGAHVKESVPSARARRGEVPVGVDNVLSKMLAKNPRDRYATAAEVAQALRPFAEA